MINIGVDEVRRILNKTITNDGILIAVDRKTDDELLKADIHKDLELDSLDFEELIIELDIQYSIYVDSSMFAESLFQKESTVENFIKTVNECGIYSA